MIHYLIIFFLSISSQIFAVDPIINISVNPPSIGTNETAEIRIDIVNQPINETPIPSTNSDKFTISYRGTSSQRQVNVINGNIEVKNIQSFIYQFIPHTTGKLTIPTFIISDKGKTLYSPATTINVEKTDRLRASNPQRNTQNPFHMFFDEPSEIFLELRPTATMVTQNTGVIIDLYIFSDDPNFINNLSPMQEYYKPRFNGGLFYLLPTDPNTSEIITEQYGYTTLYGRTIAKYIAFPLEKNQTTFIPPIFILQGRLNNRDVSGDPININSIPIASSLSYIGDDLSITTKLTNYLYNNQEHTLTITLEGNGNVDFFSNPFKQTKLSNIFISEPKQVLEVGFTDQNNSNNIFMRKTFTYTIIPSKAGSYQLPAITLNFLNKDGEKTNISSSSIDFTVLEDSYNTGNISTPLTKIVKSQDTIIYYSGINYIIISLIIGLLIVLISLLIAQKNKKLSSDIAYARAFGAKGRLKKIMAESEQAINKQQYKDAARLIRQSILYFCTDKFNLSTSSSPQEIINFLESKNIPFISKDIFLEALNALDFYAFAQEASETQIKEYLSYAYKILKEISSMKLK